jgi:hypothetical protein
MPLIIGESYAPISEGGVISETTNILISMGKGELLSSTGSGNGNLQAGTNGQVLTADDTAELGLKWSEGSSVYQNIENNAIIGQTKEIDIGNNNAKVVIQSYKFIPTIEDQTVLIESFNNGQEVNFDANLDYVIFDGAMKVTERTEVDVVPISTLGAGKSGSLTITKSNYKKLKTVTFV